MDVNLLSRLLRELIIDNDRIPLPGIGYFFTELVPASFSKDGKTIYPPSKKISFKGDDRATGDMISDYYSESSGIDKETADIEMDIFLKQLKVTLMQKKLINFPYMGKLRCTLEGSLYFVSETENSIFSQAFGFEPVILKPISNRAHDIQKEIPEPAPAVTPDNKPERQPQKRTGKVWIILLSILAAIITAAVILVELGRSGRLDSLIYSDEELELIRQQGN
ncbi:MAG TPA: hypothetical protein IAC04_07340 [Candidatus Coprenecus stercoravium]|uniref:CCDC81-like prokaryotic HU domain-containing protein n=1 Tax=Candidatus Coprenecus stercoravium TaxID=2840735 RepID=A0A9D2GSR1_9BACT|nr:hypothetical protein [Candidatus Coprenecus stercoravium]